MKMEFPNELIPFVVGLVLAPPVLTVVTRSYWQEGVKFAARLATSMVVGVAISFFMGELSFDLPEAVTAIIIDTSLVYLGSQLGYWLLWKRIEEHWIHKAPKACPASRR
jgi:hypothetical protein